MEIREYEGNDAVPAFAMIRFPDTYPAAMELLVTARLFDIVKVGVNTVTPDVIFSAYMPPTAKSRLFGALL